MWFVVAFLRKWDSKFGWFSNSMVWDAMEGGWAEVTGTPYRSYEEAEVIGVFAATTVFAEGEVKVMSLAELDDYYYGKKPE